MIMYGDGTQKTIYAHTQFKNTYAHEDKPARALYLNDVPSEEWDLAAKRINDDHDYNEVDSVQPVQTDIEYKYSEDRLINELQAYVDGTYNEHYSKNKFQATEFIIDGGHGVGFCIGNILKYAQRYGHKDGHNRKDLMKVLHYALISLHVHDMNETK